MTQNEKKQLLENLFSLPLSFQKSQRLAPLGSHQKETTSQMSLQQLQHLLRRPHQHLWLVMMRTWWSCLGRLLSQRRSPAKRGRAREKTGTSYDQGAPSQTIIITDSSSFRYYSHDFSMLPSYCCSSAHHCNISLHSNECP